MNMRKIRIPKLYMSIGAFIAALAMLCAGAFLGKVGFAAVSGSASSSNIDSTHDVSLTIRKYLGPAKNMTKSKSAPRNQGEELTMTNDLGSPLEGVEFDVYHVGGIDLTTNEGWLAAAKLKSHQISFSEIQAMKLTVTDSSSSPSNKEYMLEDKVTGKTGSNGEVKFEHKTSSTDDDGPVRGEHLSPKPSLEKGVGLYLVVENLAKSTMIKKSGMIVPTNSVTPSAPFLVTLPITDPADRDQWLYDVHVYPKNQSDTLIKMVDDSKAYAPTAHEKTVTYVLAGDITDTGDTNGDKKVDHSDLGYYLMHDTLDKDKFDMHSVKLTLQYGTAYTTFAMRLGVKDYVQHIDTATGKITVALTGAGLDKVAMANNTTPSTKVFLTIKADLKSGANLGDSPLENTAYLVPNGNWFTNNGGQKQTPPTAGSDNSTPGDFPPSALPTIPNGPTDPSNPSSGGGSGSGSGTLGIPSNKVTSTYGTIVIKKTDDAYSKMLSGAEFKLYHAISKSSSTNLVEASEDEQTCDGAIENNNFVADASPVNRQNGLYEFKNIRISTNFSSITAEGMVENHMSGKKHTKYCIVETKAPEGYELLAKPVEFELKKGASPVTEKTVADALNASTKSSDNGIIIANLPHNLGNRLPLTGASGVIVAAVAGIALLGGGLIMAMRNRRSEEEEA